MIFNPADDIIPPLLGLSGGLPEEYAALEKIPLVNPLGVFRVSFQWEGYQWPKRPHEFRDDRAEQSIYERGKNDRDS